MLLTCHNFKYMGNINVKTIDINIESLRYIRKPLREQLGGLNFLVQFKLFQLNITEPVVCLLESYRIWLSIDINWELSHAGKIHITVVTIFLVTIKKD